MGSRVMHYCISTLLGERLGLQDPQFLLGGIAPDVHKHMNAPKSVSHFVHIDDNGIASANYRAFEHKYMTDERHPFYIGYYFHLISDWIWVEDIYYKKIKFLPQPDKKLAQESYYRDFWRLNGKLIDYYGLELQPLSIVPVAIEEIDYRLLPGLIDDLRSDFERKDEASMQELELLRFDEVIQTLEKTVDVCLAHVR